MKRAIAADREADAKTCKKPKSESGGAEAETCKKPRSKSKSSVDKPKVFRGKGQPSDASGVAPKEPVGKFKEYNLKEMGVPREAWPNKKKTYTGRHGYTVIARNGAAP